MAIDSTEFRGVHNDAVTADRPLSGFVTEAAAASTEHVRRKRLRGFTHTYPDPDLGLAAENDRPLRLATLPGEWRCIPFLWWPSDDAYSVTITPRGTSDNAAVYVKGSVGATSLPLADYDTQAIQAVAGDMQAVTILLPQARNRADAVRLEYWFSSELGAADGKSGTFIKAAAQEGEFTMWHNDGVKPYIAPGAHDYNAYKALWLQDAGKDDMPFDDEIRLLVMWADAMVSTLDMAITYPTTSAHIEQANSGPDWTSHDIGIMNVGAWRIEETARSAVEYAPALSPGEYAAASTVRAATTIGLAKQYARHGRVHCVKPYGRSQGAAGSRTYVNDTCSAVSLVMTDTLAEVARVYMTPQRSIARPRIWLLVTPVRFLGSERRLGETVGLTVRLKNYSPTGALLQAGTATDLNTMPAADRSICVPYYLAVYPYSEEGHMLEGRLSEYGLTHGLYQVEIPSDALPADMDTYSDYPCLLGVEVAAKGPNVAHAGIAVHCVLVVGASQ